jgi:hypothetical protein
VARNRRKRRIANRAARAGRFGGSGDINWGQTRAKHETLEPRHRSSVRIWS